MNKKKIEKILLSFLMVISFVSTSFVQFQNVNAVSYTMNTYNYLNGVANKKGAMMNDGTVLDESSYSGITVLLTTSGRYLYCLEHGKDVHNGSGYVDGDAIDLIEEAQKNTQISAYKKRDLIGRILSIAPTSIDVSYNTSGSIKAVKGNAYQWLAAQIITWEIMVGERNADGTHREVSRSGAVSVIDGFNWDSDVKTKVMSYYNDYSKTLIQWRTIPSFAMGALEDAKTYNLDHYDSSGYYTELTDTNNVLNNYDFSMSGIDFVKNGNKLKISSKNIFYDSKDVSGVNYLEAKSRNLICLNASGGYQKVATAGETVDPIPSAFLKVKIGLGNLQIVKYDDYRSVIKGAVFSVTDPTGNVKDYTTDSNGKIIINNVIVGEYKIKEKSAPHGYLINANTFTANVTVGATATVEVFNDEPKGTITVTKTNDIGTKVANAKFYVKAAGNITNANGKVLYASGAVVDTLITNSNGSDTTIQLPLGNYIVEEYEVPYGYLLNKNKFNVQLKYANQNTPLVTTSTTVTNKEPLGTIEFQKEVDSNVTNNLNGDVFLSNLKYGLYARNDIKNVAGTKTYYAKDTLISQKVTDENGHIEWTDLHIGDYYLKELETNDSLLINSTPIDVSLTYKDMNTSVVSSKTSAKDIIASQRIQIFKEGIKDGIAGVVAGLQGAEFTFKLNSEYNHVGWDNAKTYFVGTTDKNGFLTTNLLPYGTYRVRETKTPDGYYGASDFLITVEKDSSLYEIGYKIKKVTVNNVPFETLLKIRKVDSETDKTVLKKGNVYKLKNLDKDEYVSYVDWSQFPNINVDKWETHEDGTITLNTMLQAGHYQLEEIDCSEGYLLNKEPLKFELTKDMDYDIAEDGVTPIVTITFENKPVKGKIKLSKEGEVLTGYDEKEKNFIYEKIGLANAVYDILAEKDILDPCNDKTVLYHAGEVVDTITTNEDGQAESKLLPLGDYEVKEKESPSGFVLNNEVKKVSLTYEDKETEIVYEDVDFYNERQKVEIETSKQDSDTQDYVEGAELTLKANRDIYNYKGDVIVKAGTLLETVVSNSKGKVKFVTDLPNDLTPKDGVMPIDDDLNNDIDHEFSQTVVDGVRLIGDPNSLFMVYESKEPVGYMPYELNYYIDTSYTNQNEQVLKFETPFFNDITVTEILKTNGSELIKGAHMQILDEKGKIYDEWISDGTSHMSKGLPLDKELILHEVEPPHGYTLADDIKFIVRDYQKIEMIDKPIVRFRKLDSDSKIFVKGVHMQIIEKETDKTVYDFITDDKAMELVLDYGKTYIAREIETVESYYKNVEDVEFIATPNLTVDFYNSPIFTRLQVNKIDKDTKELIINNPFTFAVFADKNCTHLLDILETDSNKGIALSQIVLRYGKVYLKEIKAPDGYIINRDVIEININGELEGVGDIYTIVVENEKAPKPVITVTNDSTMIGIFVILFGASFCIFLKLRKCKKSK